VGEVPPLTQLYRKFRSQGFHFFIIYTREAHPGENYPHHESFQQKLASAKQMRELDSIDDIPILVDEIGGATHTAYGQLPNMIYLIDAEGVIVYKSDWTDTNEIDDMCASLVRRDEMKANQVPIIRQSISQRLHWIPMDPKHRERVYRRSGEKAIRDYQAARGVSPYASDAAAKRG
jgi:hypothetical protein